MHELAADDDAETPPARASRRRSERSRGRRWGLRILAVFLGLVFLVVALLGGFALFLNHKVDSNVKREALLPSQAGAASPSTTWAVNRVPVSRGIASISVTVPV